MECSKTPCEMSWLIEQPGLNEEDGKHSVDQLVSINKASTHASVKVTCNNPDVESFADHLVLYTNSAYKKV